MSILWPASEEKQSSNDNLCKPLFLNLQQSCIVCNQWLDTWNPGCPLCKDLKCCNHWRAGQCGRGHYWSLFIACKQASDAGNGIRWSTDVATTSTWEWWCTWSKVVDMAMYETLESWPVRQAVCCSTDYWLHHIPFLSRCICTTIYMFLMWFQHLVWATASNYSQCPIITRPLSSSWSQVQWPQTWGYIASPHMIIQCYRIVCTVVWPSLSSSPDPVWILSFGHRFSGIILTAGECCCHTLFV